MHPTEELLRALLQRPSVTPDDQNCQQLIAEQLQPLGFHCRKIPLNATQNLWATHGQGAPLMVLAGHTDVVPAKAEEWQSDPFTPTVRDGMLYGRGAADMKSGVAAMTVALSEFVRAHPDHPGTVALLLTSDEEGSGVDGTRAVLERLSREGVRIDFALVGEPTSKHTLGDSARIGRRGSLHLELSVQGQEGHVAYPEKVNNPIFPLARIAAELGAQHWDAGNSDFPPTSFQISNIAGGLGAENVVPARASFQANWRYNTENSEASLRARVEPLLERVAREYGVAITAQWRLSGAPFRSPRGKLSAALTTAIARHCPGVVCAFNTAGGTSDARFFAPLGCEVLEFGPNNATIHKNDECVRVDDLPPLTAIYRDLLAEVLA